ncbi:hypothetical protein, partial [Streptococcus pyogenes]|uniref:hypothetical protein n=1 Tax=Streptococcus pyogenes TaxID=1314 RepID=UPI001F19FD49
RQYEIDATLLPQQKASVLAHFVCKNRKPNVKSAELFMLFEHKTGVVYVLTLVSIIQEFLFIFR